MSTYRLQVREPRGTLHDVFVTAEDGSPTAQLEAGIEAVGFRAKPLGVGGRSLSSATTVGELALEHGDVVECGRLGTPGGAPGIGTYVVAVAGPDAGRWRRLAPGQRLVVGRDADGMRLADPLLSARHCVFELTREDDGRDDGSVLVSDAGSTNGTFVEQDEVHDPTPLERGGYVQAGSSVLAVVTVDGDDLAVLGEPEGGAAVLPRQYRRALPGLPDRVDAPTAREPEKADSSNMWWRSVIPLVSGAGFALITGRWIFLLIMAIAPIVFTYDALKRHRRQARRHETAHAKYLAELDRYTTELHRAAPRRATAAAGGHAGRRCRPVRDGAARRAAVGAVAERRRLPRRRRQPRRPAVGHRVQATGGRDAHRPALGHAGAHEPVDHRVAGDRRRAALGARRGTRHRPRPGRHALARRRPPHRAVRRPRRRRLGLRPLAAAHVPGRAGLPHRPRPRHPRPAVHDDQPAARHPSRVRHGRQEGAAADPRRGRRRHRAAHA
ncbi:MAG: FHA domain-containing protein [Ilumatobacteraceae bacterium]